MSNDEGSIGSNEVSEVMSLQVSQEMMGPATVTDLPRYHSLVEDFGRLADRWMAAGQLRDQRTLGVGTSWIFGFLYLVKKGTSCWGRS